MTAEPIEPIEQVEPIERAAVPSGGNRLLAAATPDYGTHLATYGPLPNVGGPQLLAQVKLSGLTGRGGAGFPAALKLQAVAAGRRSGAAVVVANGAEGEPASLKDRHLMLTAPHLVLDGLQVAALITGATEGFVYSRPDAVLALRQALRERAGTGIDRIAVTVVEAGPGFVTGQETAVVSRLNDGPALPRYAPVRVTERGVQGRPTLVQNVETLGHLALIARYGGFWFAGLGSDDATGTFLATVHDPAGGFGLSGTGSRVWEVPHGLPLGRLLEAAEPPVQLQAVLVGGFHGTWLPLPDALPAPLSRSGLAPFGGSIGAGVIMPLPTKGCGLEATAQIVRYLAAESAGQCGPCAFGLPQLAGLISALASGSGGESVLQELRQAAGLVEGRGACHHPDGTARLVRSALTTFDQDVRLHQHGRCLARIGETYGGGA
jgi:NADH:ubiquinone oxidoreductase subunit F (NADH-binding)